MLQIRKVSPLSLRCTAVPPPPEALPAPTQLCVFTAHEAQEGQEVCKVPQKHHDQTQSWTYAPGEETPGQRSAPNRSPTFQPTPQVVTGPWGVPVAMFVSSVLSEQNVVIYRHAVTPLGHPSKRDRLCNSA